MKQPFLILITALCINTANAQIKFEVLETIEELSFWAKNVIPIASDSNCSSFLIRVQEEVKPHYHSYHTEHIYVVKGSAILKLGDSTMTVKPGDLIVIPPKVVHSVKVNSFEPFEVLSIQSPGFKGEDRIWVE